MTTMRFPVLLAACILVGLSLAPTVSAEVPDPVGLACDTLQGTAPELAREVPFCPGTGDPGAPAEGRAEDGAGEKPQAPSPAPEAAPEDVGRVADAAREAAEEAARDPAHAAEPVAGFVATILDFVRDRVGGVPDGVASVIAAAEEAFQRLGAGLEDGLREAVGKARDLARVPGDAARGVREATEAAAHAVSEGAGRLRLAAEAAWDRFLGEWPVGSAGRAPGLRLGEDGEVSLPALDLSRRAIGELRGAV